MNVRDGVLDVSIVIPSLGRPEGLRQQMVHLGDTLGYHQVEIVVVDQSTSCRLEASEFPDLDLTVLHPSYQSLTRARNDGVRIAKGRVVVFLDDDAHPNPGWLETHIDALANEQIAGSTGPVLAPGEKLQHYDSAEYETAYKRGRVLANAADRHFVTWTPGCNMAFRKDVVISVGGFDERFYGIAIGEDSEFSVRVRQQCGPIVFSPGASVIHYCAESGGSRSEMVNDRRVRAHAENLVYAFVRMNAPFGHVARGVISGFRTNCRVGGWVRLFRNTYIFLTGAAQGWYNASKRLPLLGFGQPGQSGGHASVQGPSSV